jgi:hypothetical protein
VGSIVSWWGRGRRTEQKLDHALAVLNLIVTQEGLVMKQLEDLKLQVAATQAVIESARVFVGDDSTRIAAAVEAATLATQQELDVLVEALRVATAQLAAALAAVNPAP